MSKGFGDSDCDPFMQASQTTSSKSPGSSFNSLNGDFDASTEDVDDLLSALEASTNNHEFLKSNDDDFVKEMLGSERQQGSQQEFLTAGETRELDYVLAGQNSMPSLGGLEPLGLDDVPSDPNLLAGLAEDLNFQHNSAKLDEFLHKAHLSDTQMGLVNHSENKEPELPRELTVTELYPEMSFEPRLLAGGKRRRVPRRGSLPTMHLKYEDPFEPTPEDPFEPTPEDPFEPTPMVNHQARFSQHEEEAERPTKLAAVPVDNSMAAFDTPPGSHRRAQRRGSLPTMHLNCSSASFIHNNADNGYIEEEKHVDIDIVSMQMVDVTDVTSMQVDEPESTSHRRMQRRGSTGSYFGGSSLGLGDVSATVPENLDPEKMMKRLQEIMENSMSTQKQLQKWDKDNGLPKSHSQTMVNTSRSRKQLQDGVILPKWDGTPLISEDAELGRPKPRSRAHKKEGGKMERRMSAPASSALY